MWSLRNIYMYLVSFVSLMLIIGGLISSLGSLSNSFFPQDYSSSMTYYEGKMSGINEEQYKIQMEKRNEQNRTNEKNRNINNAIKGIIMVCVSLPFYIYHWKKIEASQAK